MTMQLSHATLRDETLTHQVRFAVHGGGGVQVSCNCRISQEGMTVGRYPRPITMGSSNNIDESRELYNNPDNHFAPFGEEDKAKW